MNEYLPSPEWLQQMRAAAAAPGPQDSFVRGLRGRLVDRGLMLQTRGRIRARLAWGLAVAAILLAAGVLIAGPQNVVLALQRILGYIPGVGIVQSGTIRVLDEPVTVTRDGITLTLEQVVADSSQTVVIYKAEGLSVKVANSNGEGGPLCAKSEAIRLADGTELAIAGGNGDGWGSGYRSRLLFPAIPTNINEGTFLVPCIADMPPGKAPEDWSFHFRLKPAPLDLTVMPVVDVATPIVQPSVVAATAGPTKAETYEITASLDSVVTREDGYTLLGSLHWKDDRFAGVTDGIQATVTDADGMQIPVEKDYDDYGMARSAEPNAALWAYRIQGKAFHGPLTLTFRYVGVDLRNPVPVQFDTGANPRVGQSLEINQSLQVLGIPVTLLSAKMIAQGDMQGFEFTVQAPLALRAMALGLEKSPGLVQTKERCCGSGGGSAPNQTGMFKTYALSDFSVAGGTINLSIRHVELSGNWSVEWNPPVVEGWPTATALPQACLTDAKWNQLSAGPAVALPAGLGGKILTMRGALAPDPSLFLSGVDGGGEKGLVFGDGSLSPDGKTLVFAGQDNRFYVMDLESGGKTALTLPGVTGTNPRWSPDGKYIAMSQFLENYHVVVMKADGSGLRRVTQGVSIEELSGWSPDGEQVLYTVLGEGGKHYLKLADIDTGTVTDLFAIDWKNPSPALSPDGKWVAYLDRPFGAYSAGVYVARLDGSGRRLMTQLEAQPSYAFSPFWSPDGKWLAVSIQDANAFMPGDPSIALIQPDTCEVVPMTGVKGEIRSWVP
jgi:WD40 repeat protein